MSLDPKDFLKPGCKFGTDDLRACCCVHRRVVPGSGSRGAGKLLKLYYCRVWEIPLRMIKMMNTLSDEIPGENGSGAF